MLIHPRIHHRRAGHRFTSGLTLIELLVVLMVLIAVAGIVVPNLTDLRFEFAGERKSASQIATEKTLIEVRSAILGTDGKKGLWRDLGEREVDLPRTISELFERRVEPPEQEWPATFDRNTRLGWRGPYIQPTGAQLGPELAGLGYGNATDPAILDGWGRPIVILPLPPLPNPNNAIRLVSSGEDGDLGTADDIVLYLRTDNP